MAVLEKIRNNAGLVVGVVGLGLFAFVVGDALQSGSTFFGNQEMTILSINGEEVSYLDYDKRIQQMQEMQQSRGAQLSDEQRMMLNNQLAQQYIADYALGEVANEIGLRVTPEEVYALLHGGKGLQPSRTAMQFFSGLGIDINNADAVNEFINQMSDRHINTLPEESQQPMRMLQAQWLEVSRAIERERKQEKLASLLSRSYKITKLDEALAMADGSRTVALVRTTAPVVSDDTQQATEDEIKAYYDKHLARYRMPSPMTELSYISTQVTPSSDDYLAAEQEASRVLAELSAATTSEDVARVVRAAGGNSGNAYLTGAELERMGLGATSVSFIKEAQPGAVHTTGLVDNNHTLIKLVAKKSGPESINVRYMVLDSAMSQRVDSLQAELRSGASFSDLATRHSVDQQTAAKGGLLELPNEFGMTDSKITEFMASQLAQQSGMELGKLFSEPIGTVLTFGQPNARILMRAESPAPAVEKYNVALVQIAAPFSAKTYDAQLEAMNRILVEGGSFDDMAAKAEKEGFSITRQEYAGAGSAQLGRIPGSRSLIQWALNAPEGEVTDKVHRIGADYLAIATVIKHLPAGHAPLAMVRDGIKAAVESDKRAEALAANLTNRGLTTLDAYAKDLNTQIDTLVGVSYLVRGSESPAFNGKAMTTPVGQVSKPFVAGYEVMVVQPLSVEPANAEAVASQSRQSERNVGYQLFARSMSSLIEGLKIEDNRGKFY